MVPIGQAAKHTLIHGPFGVVCTAVQTLETKEATYLIMILMCRQVKECERLRPNGRIFSASHKDVSERIRLKVI